MTTQQYTKQLQKTYFYLAIGLLLSFTFSVFSTYTGFFKFELQNKELFKIFTPIFCISTIVISYFLSYKKKKSLTGQTNLHFKLNKYRELYFIKIGTLAGTSLFVIIIFSLTKDFQSIILFLIIYILLLLNHTSSKKICNTLKFTTTDKLFFNDNNKIEVDETKSFIPNKLWSIIIVVILIYLIYSGIKDLI